jgi:hypothetical protein
MAMQAAASQPPAKPLRTVVALYDYTAAEPTELSFCSGDIINVLSMESSEWWLGKIRDTGVQGLFPSLFTQEINLDADLPGAIHQSNPSNATQIASDSVECVRALFDYTAACAGEMTMLSGDLIEVLSKSTGSDAWWEGRNTRTAEVGQFPKDYAAIS